MNEPVTQQDFVLRRLEDAWQLGGRELGGKLWLAIAVPVLILGLIYVVWMYRRDSRTIAWPFAVGLGLLRSIVYVTLATVFLLPAWQTWETTQKRSRVVVLIDVSPSMAEKTDELPPEDGTSAKLPNRLDKVVQFLTDAQAAFISKLCEKNPVYVYRFGARLDDEPAVFFKDQPTWDAARWQQWLRLDPKRWLLDHVDESTRAALARHSAFENDKPGTADWATQWLKLPPADVLPGGLDDAQRDKLMAAPHPVGSPAGSASATSTGYRRRRGGAAIVEQGSRQYAAGHHPDYGWPEYAWQ